MSQRFPSPPQPGRILYENLFSPQDSALTLQRISDGLTAVIDNAGFLLEDARLLADSQRYARAGFLIATAEEEIAKGYILLDACRLDFQANESQLRVLCRAFYDHVAKYAYYHTLRLNREIRRRNVRDLGRIREFFQNDLRRWWPSTDIESGEPDMPHDTYFTRESNLYVDFGDWDNAWILPRPNNRGFFFDRTFGQDTISETHDFVGRLKSSQDDGLFQPQVLGLLNTVFRGHYITERTTTAELWSRYDTLAIKIEAAMGLPQPRILESSLITWPLYHFL